MEDHGRALPDIEVARDPDALTILNNKLTSQAALDGLVAALKANAFELSIDDEILIATATELLVVDEDANKRGFEVIQELGDLQLKIVEHYARFKGPLNTLVNTVRALEGEVAKPLEPVKQALSRRLGAFKVEQDRLAREKQRRDQEAADAAARAAQAAKAATYERIAEAEPNPALAEAFRQESAAVAAVQVKAAPVEIERRPAPIAGASVRTTWSAEVFDFKLLMEAWLAGRCHLDIEPLMDALGPQLNKQATALKEQVEKAYPGVRAVPVHAGVRRRR